MRAQLYGSVIIYSHNYPEMLGFNVPSGTYSEQDRQIRFARHHIILQAVLYRFYNAALSNVYTRVPMICYSRELIQDTGAHGHYLPNMDVYFETLDLTFEALEPHHFNLID